MPNTTRIRLVGSMILLCLTLGAARLAAEDKITDVRAHFTVVGAGGAPAGSATRVVRHGPTYFLAHTLFERSTGDALVREDRTDYAKKTMEWTVRNVKGDAWITARVTLPFSGKTADEAMAEFRDTEARVFTLMRDELEFETNAGSWKGSEAGWSGDAKLEFTKQLRTGTSFDLLEMIERNADVAFVDLVDLEQEVTLSEPLILEYLLYRPRCGRSAARATVAVPDCDFDERLGFPCNEKQLAKVKKAREAGEPLDHY